MVEYFKIPRQVEVEITLQQVCVYPHTFIYITPYETPIRPRHIFEGMFYYFNTTNYPTRNTSAYT